MSAERSERSEIPPSVARGGHVVALLQRGYDSRSRLVGDRLVLPIEDYLKK